MDYNNKVIYADSPIISEMYLGKEHKFYLPLYQAEFEQRQIMPDVVSGFLNIKMLPNHDEELTF
jgi:hypothetical protein